MRGVYPPFHTRRLLVMLWCNPLVPLVIDTPVMLSCSRSAHTHTTGRIKYVRILLCFRATARSCLWYLSISKVTMGLRTNGPIVYSLLRIPPFLTNTAEFKPQRRFKSYVRFQSSCCHSTQLSSSLWYRQQNVNFLQWLFL